MKKVLLALLVMVSLVTGCRGQSDEEIKMEKYAYIYQTITDNDSFLSNSDKYDINVTMSANGKEYTYYVNIDNPRIAMYELQVMCVENDVDYALVKKIMPTIGILDDESYNLIPNQVDVERGYLKGVILSGTTDRKILNLKIRVAYKDYLLVKETQDYLSITVDYDSLFEEEQPEEPQPAAEEENKENSTDGE